MTSVMKPKYMLINLENLQKITPLTKANTVQCTSGDNAFKGRLINLAASSKVVSVKCDSSNDIKTLK